MTSTASDPPAGSGQPAGSASWSHALAAYRDGAGVIQRLGSKFVDWGLPTPCPGWNALDLAGHLLCVARRHHRLLDAALAGTPVEGLPAGADLDALNAAELVALGVSAGTERIVAFDAVTTRYSERLAEVEPSLPVGSWAGPGTLAAGHGRLTAGHGTLTVAEHTLIAAAEWHLHAWDLAGALGWDYRPRNPAALLAGQRRFLGAVGEGEPWAALLAASGRRPVPGPRPLGP